MEEIYQQLVMEYGVISHTHPFGDLEQSLCLPLPACPRLRSRPEGLGWSNPTPHLLTAPP